MKIKIKIDPKDVKVRNELHFDVQRHTKMNIVKSKKIYDRKKINSRNGANENE